MNRIPTFLRWASSPIHGQLIMWNQIIYLRYTTINLISHFFLSVSCFSNDAASQTHQTSRWLMEIKLGQTCSFQSRLSESFGCSRCICCLSSTSIDDLLAPREMSSDTTWAVKKEIEVIFICFTRKFPKAIQRCGRALSRTWKTFTCLPNHDTKCLFKLECFNFVCYFLSC